MPRRHSSMGVLQPAKNETLTNARVQANNLDQEAVVFHELSELVNNVVQTQYVDNYQAGDVTSIQTAQAYDINYGQELEDRLNLYAGYTDAPNMSAKVQQLATSTLTTVQNARQAFDVVNNSNNVKQQLETIREQYSTLETKAIDAGLIQGKRFSAGIQTEIEANVSLDLRYLYYIKQYGPPPNGVFDPVKLAEFVWTDSSGNPLTDQNYVQYTGLGLSVPVAETDESARQYEEFWTV
jgi:hypothetical protein